MTGEKLFLQYAFPCVEDRERAGAISTQHREELSGWIVRNVQPARRRLKFCFPKAFEALRALAQRTRRAVWSLENVQDYWRNNHGHSGDCRVVQIAVEEIRGRVVVSKNQFFVNICNLPLSPGDKVYVHRRCVVEKVDEALL